MTGRSMHLGATIVGGLSLVPFGVFAQEVRIRPLLSTSQIVAAMQDRRLPTRGVSIQLPAAITSTTTNPVLAIEAATPINLLEVRLRITCRDRSECLPFFAVASYPEPIDPAAFPTNAARQPVAIAKTPPLAKAIAETPVESDPGQLTKPAKVPIILSGSSATLDFDEERVHVRVDVICLDSGATGDKIRVTTRDRKQIYVAEVVAPGALKGTLTR